MPSLIILLLIARLFKEFNSSPLVKAVVGGIRPAVIGLILTAVFVLGRSVLIEIKAIVIAVAAFLLLLRGRMHPISVICLSAVLGVLFY